MPPHLLARYPLILLLSLLLALGQQPAGEQPAETNPDGAPVLVGAGDIASCESDGDEATARLLDTIDGAVFTLGDNVYETGTAQTYARCYDPSWGRHRARTHPAPGNHDLAAGSDAYHDYFGPAAGPPGAGYYSYDLGVWHIVVLNSNCATAGGCQAGSPQERWLRADLAAHAGQPVLAYWHHPRFSSGLHGSDTAVDAFWQALYDYNAEIVLSGHDHHYERFAPQNPAGQADPHRGIRQFVVGAGGRSHYPVVQPLPTSEVHDDRAFGVLKLTLHATSYDWEFIPIAGQTFTDAGSAATHHPLLGPVAPAGRPVAAARAMR